MSPILKDSFTCEVYPENKLCKIQPKVDDPIPSYGQCRHEETAFNVNYILVTLFKLIFICLQSEEPPVCTPCDRLCSIEHLLTEYVDLLEWRRQFFNAESLSVLFRECSPDNISQFLKETNLFGKM